MLVASTEDGDTPTVESGNCGFGKSDEESAGEGGEQVYIEEYRQRVEGKVLEIVETHPTIAVIHNRKAVTDLQLVALERTLPQELGGGECAVVRVEYSQGV